MIKIDNFYPLIIRRGFNETIEHARHRDDLGSFAALIHLVWLIFIGIGVAKPFVDWIMSLHMMQCTWGILPFAWGTAIILLIVTSIIGYIFGWVFARLWNYFHQ